MYRVMKENTSGWLPSYCFDAEAPAFSSESEAVAWASEKVRCLLPGSTVSTMRVERNELMGFFAADNGRGVEVKASVWTPDFWWQSQERYIVPTEK